MLVVLRLLWGCGGQAAATAANGTAAEQQQEGSTHGVFQPEGISSIVVVCALWAVRAYFVLVVMAYARLVLRRHVAATSRNRPELYSGSKSAGVLEDPFGAHLPEGKGWRGWLGRKMVGSAGGIGWVLRRRMRGGWRGEEIGMGRLGTRRREGGNGGSEAPGVVERERRRRSGTVGFLLPLGVCCDRGFDRTDSCARDRHHHRPNCKALRDSI